MDQNLQDKIETLLDKYFKDLDGENPNGVYDMAHRNQKYQYLGSP